MREVNKVVWWKEGRRQQERRSRVIAAGQWRGLGRGRCAE